MAIVANLVYAFLTSGTEDLVCPIFNYRFESISSYHPKVNLSCHLTSTEKFEKNDVHATNCDVQL